MIEHSLGHLKPGLVLFCVLLPRKQADTVMALNTSHTYYTWDTDVAHAGRCLCVRPLLLLSEAIHNGYFILKVADYVVPKDDC